MSVLALVPARGGSKGLPGKNLAEVGGRSLVARAIEVARAEPRIDTVAVSSDDPAILEAATRAGAEAWRRPAALAGDAVATLDVVRHHLGEHPEVEVLVLLQPTSPLRVPADVAACLDLLDATGSEGPEGPGGPATPVGSVVTVTPLEHPWQWSVELGEGGGVSPVAGWPAFSRRRQDLPAGYRLNGAVYVVRREWLERAGAFVGPGTRAVVMPPERSVDVDSAADLALARALTSHRPPAGAP